LGSLSGEREPWFGDSEEPSGKVGGRGERRSRIRAIWPLRSRTVRRGREVQPGAGESLRLAIVRGVLDDSARLARRVLHA